MFCKYCYYKCCNVIPGKLAAKDNTVRLSLTMDGSFGLQAVRMLSPIKWTCGAIKKEHLRILLTVLLQCASIKTAVLQFLHVYSSTSEGTTGTALLILLHSWKTELLFTPCRWSCHGIHPVPLQKQGELLIWGSNTRKSTLIWKEGPRQDFANPDDT